MPPPPMPPPSNGGKVTPNLAMDAEGTRLLNITVLQRLDPAVEDILITAAHVTLYDFNIDLNQWSRKDVEGSLFVVKRNTQPRFQFIVMNRRNTDNLVEDLLSDFEYELQPPYLLYRNAAQEVNGIWFYNQQDCDAVANLFGRILNAYARVPPKAKVPSAKSEFEELEAVPTSAAIDGPLEPLPASTVISDTPDESLANYFGGAASIGGVSSAAMVGRAHPSTESTASSHMIIQSAAPSHQIPPPLGGSSAPPLPLHDTHASHSTNLLTPAFFAPPLSSSASLAPPVSSMMPTAPPLHPTSTSAQHPQYGHGTPLLQPFPRFTAEHMFSSLRRFLRRLRAMTLSSEDAGATVSEGDRRPWEPPFDASKPAPPISYPITELAALASRSYLSEASNFHLPFNRASTPLSSPGAPLPARRRLLVCHDMQGGYGDDAAPQGGANPDAYALWHWHLMDVFVYFSHYLVTLPPPCWTNAAHLHGVKVLGTFITEWDKGAEICREMFATEESAQMYADRLAELAATLGFDGWLINIEVKLDIQFIDNLKEFVNHLTKRMHAAVPGSLVLWYDAVTVNGDLDWQDKLNGYNKPFFDLCDGLFVNYTWKAKYPQDSAAAAGDRKYDVYMGIDVFGRNTYGGGQWNTNVALDLLKKDDISTAIFAPGWIYETKQPPDFQSAQNRWWGLVEESWGVLQSYPKELPFYSDFDQGHGYEVSHEGLQVSGDPWNNISCQSFQPMLKYTGDKVQPPVQTSINFKDEQYSGGGCVTVKGSLKQNAISSEQLFNGGLSTEDGSIHLFYSVNADANCVLGLSLDLSSRDKGNTSILIADDIATFHGKEHNYMYSSYVQSDKVAPQAPENHNWVLYQATVQSSAGYTLTGINVVCALKTAGKINTEIEEDGSSETNDNKSLPYRASLGHVSILNSNADTLFPPAKSWVTEGGYISWSKNSNASKLLSLKISWKLNTSHQASFMKYNIYVEKLTANSNAKASRSFLGVASVEAFYVSDLQVPDEVTTLKFIIQACGRDGSHQKLEECPKLFLVPVDHHV